MAIVESVLLYGSEARTLTKSLEKQLIGCYTRLLQMVFNVHWKEHVTTTIQNNDEGNNQDSGVQDAVYWAQHKARGGHHFQN